MGILDKIRKKDDKTGSVKTEAHSNELKKDAKKAGEKKVEAKHVKSSASVKKADTKNGAKKKKVAAKEKTPVAHFDLIRKPHISEKAFYSGEENKYVFRVSKKANKTEIKKAVENIYQVSVDCVNIVNMPGKKKIYRGMPGEKSGYKKAIVKLKKGETIDVIEGA